MYIHMNAVDAEAHSHACRQEGQQRSRLLFPHIRRSGSQGNDSPVYVHLNIYIHIYIYIYISELKKLRFFIYIYVCVCVCVCVRVC